MISDNESHLTIDNNDRFIVLPSIPSKNQNLYYDLYGTNQLQRGIRTPVMILYKYLTNN